MLREEYALIVVFEDGTQIYESISCEYPHTDEIQRAIKINNTIHGDVDFAYVQKIYTLVKEDN